MNRIVLKGNLVDDPEVTQVGANDTDKCKFRVASNQFGGETLFLDIEAWRKTAVNCGKYLVKGSPVLVDGRLVQNNWEKDGEKRSKVFISADAVEFLGKPAEKEDEDSEVPF